MSMTVEETQAVRSGYPKPTPNTPNHVLKQFDLHGRVACISGASDGIGWAVAEALAEAGADVALWYNSNPAAVEKGEQLAKTLGRKVKAWQVNVSEHEQVQKGIEEVVKEFGKLDIMVANAGMGISGGILDMPIEQYRKGLAVNLDGVFYCAKYAGLEFRKQGSGNLIINSSISAHIVNVPVDQPVYNASKAAVTQLGKCLAREWRDFARVNIVSPGYFDTKMGASDDCLQEGMRMTVLGRQGNTKEIKGVFLYLASDASSYQTGTDIIIDGGYTLP